MAIANSYKLLFLAGLHWDASDLSTRERPVSLYQALKAASHARLSTDSQGHSLLKTFLGSPEQAVRFALPLNGHGLTPKDAANLCRELLQLHALAVTRLRERKEPADDAHIYEAMSELLKGEPRSTAMAGRD